jgi:hypothetical protein
MGKVVEDKVIEGVLIKAKKGPNETIQYADFIT